MNVAISANRARELGYVVDDTCYPPLAYRGPRFQPDELFGVLTNLEAELLEDACHEGSVNGTLTVDRHGYVTETHWAAAKQKGDQS